MESFKGKGGVYGEFFYPRNTASNYSYFILRNSEPLAQEFDKLLISLALFWRAFEKALEVLTFVKDALLFS